MPITLENLHSMGAERPKDYLKFAENPESVQRTLQWLRDLSSQEFNFVGSEKRVYDQFQTLHEQLARLAGVASQSLPEKRPQFLVAVGDYLFKNLRKGLNHLMQGRKKRKWLTILGTMGLGTAIGMVLGTIVFPVVGTAVGGVIGSTIGAVSTAVAGPIGLSLLGGAFGTWIGRRFAKRFAPEKSVYNIPSKIKTKLKTILNLEEEELVKLHAYIVNRKNSVKDPTLKKALQLLDNAIFKNPTPAGIARLTDFLQSELTELEQLEDPNAQHREDKQFIQAILAKLPIHLNQKQTRPDTHVIQDKKIESKIAPQQQQFLPMNPDSSMLPRVRSKAEKIGRSDLVRFSQHQHSPEIESGIVLQTPRYLDQKAFQQFEGNFQAKAMEIFQFKGVRKNVLIGEESPGHRKVQYQCEYKNVNMPPIDIMFQETQQQQGVQVEMYATVSPNKDIQDVAKIIALQMKYYIEQSLTTNKQRELIVVANGDKNVAITFLTAAYKEGLSPSLDLSEFPNEQDRKEIVNSAKKQVSTENQHFGLRLR